jgi:hypothetical protein
MRSARRRSSASSSNSRWISRVSSATPSVVVKIWALAMLAPAAAQAPVSSASSRGWSGASTVSSVIAVKRSVAMADATCSPASSALAMRRAWATWLSMLEFSQ